MTEERREKIISFEMSSSHFGRCTSGHLRPALHGLYCGVRAVAARKNCEERVVYE